MDYPVESFRERADSSRPHFTNLDRPVFALVNLPETVKGAMFARYSRYQGTLRRMYLDEFADDAAGPAPAFDGAEGERARALYERIFLGYGDDSVAQLGGAHIACEWVSNVMTKLLQRGRLAAYLEQSTRYMAYDAPMGEGLGYRYWRSAELGPEYEQAMDFLFSTYSEILPRVEAWAAERFRAPRASRRRLTAARFGPRRSTCCAACSRRRRSRTWASSPPARPTSSCCCGCSASPLPEARDYAPDDPHRAQGGDAELRGAGGAARARRGVDRVPGGARPDSRALGGAIGPRPRARLLRGRGPRSDCCR